MNAQAVTDTRLLPPIGSQEVWAAGVTYIAAALPGWRNRASQAAAASTIALRGRTARVVLQGHSTSRRRARGRVRIRADSRWSVPEPELALVVNRRGAIVGCTIGNDMSARDIEGENPLYLPQAKVYAACCALGPAVLLGRGALRLRRPSNSRYVGMALRCLRIDRCRDAEAYGRRARRIPLS